MVNASLISRLSHAVDLIEQRSKQNRPWKIVKVRRGYGEDPHAAKARHFAAHFQKPLFYISIAQFAVLIKSGMCSSNGNLLR